MISCVIYLFIPSQSIECLVPGCW